MEGEQLVRAERVMGYLRQVEKSSKKEKVKNARDDLLQKSLEDDSTCLEAVYEFREDPKVAEVFRSEAMLLLQGYVTKSRYGQCLGLIAARLMYW